MARTAQQPRRQRTDEGAPARITRRKLEANQEAGHSTSHQSGFTPPMAGDFSVSLPIDIFGAILDELLEDKTFLLQCRLLSKDLLAITDSRAFRRLSVWYTGPSATRGKDFLDNVANVPSLSVHVREIVWKEETSEVNADALEAFLSSVKALTKFPNVNTLRFRFPTAWNEPFDDDSEMSSSRNLQIKLLKELADVYSDRPQPTLHLLEIRNLITLANESIRSDAFKELLQHIPNLVISLVTNDGEDFNHSDDGYSTFLDVDLTGILNSAKNLTSLTLESDIKTFYNWAKAETLPNLHQLELRNFVFGYLFSPEDFILRHKSTIRRLNLIRCCFDTEPHTRQGGPAQARVWKDAFETFQHELLGLVDIVFEPLPGVNDDEDGFPQVDGYVWLDTEGGYKNYFGDEDVTCARGVEDDRLAYEFLQQSIKKRRGKQSSV